ncbi:MAG TPA: hypothetical protein VJ499_09890 [Flavisolibacter sp.]|nr:hypothetical protein [Flavisolibacter sp.]
MISSIASYYIDELDEWKAAIDLRLEEVNELEEWLNQILQNNSVTQLAAKVEHYMNQLLLAAQNLEELREQLEDAEKPLYKGQAPIENELLTEQSKQHQKELRMRLYNLEKEILDIRYHCDEFLGDTITAQNKKGSNTN